MNVETNPILHNTQRNNNQYYNNDFGDVSASEISPNTSLHEDTEIEASSTVIDLQSYYSDLDIDTEIINKEKTEEQVYEEQRKRRNQQLYIEYACHDDLFSVEWIIVKDTILAIYKISKYCIIYILSIPMLLFYPIRNFIFPSSIPSNISSKPSPTYPSVLSSSSSS